MNGMIDLSDSPTSETLTAAKQNGVTFVAGYIGGATPHVWTKEDFIRVIEAGMYPVAIYVYDYTLGLSQITKAVNLALSLGFSRVVIDCEAEGIPYNWLLSNTDLYCSLSNLRRPIEQSYRSFFYAPFNVFFILLFLCFSRKSTFKNIFSYQTIFICFIFKSFQ